MSTTLLKNVASQRIRVYAYTPADGLPKTGDAANLTCYIAKDYGAVTALTDTSATEEDATNAPGYYWFDITQTETNADNIMVTCKSSTSGVKVLGAPAIIGTRPATGFLAPTTAGRTLDVSAGGEAGMDWANVGSPTTTLDLSGTTIKTTQKVDVDTIKTQSVTCAAGVTVLAQVGAAAAPGTNGGLATVDASNRIAGMQGTKHTLDDLNDLSAAGVRSAVGLASANLDTQIATLATLTKLLKYVQLLARKDSAIATDNATELTAINANGGSGAGGYDNTTDAQEALRDRGDAAWITVAAATIRSAVGLASANLDTQLDAIPTANENADAHLDRADAIEAGITPRGAHRLAVAAAAGKVDGAATTTMHVRDVADGKNRVTATVDANGNRTATSVDVS